MEILEFSVNDDLQVTLLKTEKELNLIVHVD